MSSYFITRVFKAAPRSRTTGATTAKWMRHNRSLSVLVNVPIFAYTSQPWPYQLTLTISWKSSASFIIPQICCKVVLDRIKMTSNTCYNTTFWNKVHFMLLYLNLLEFLNIFVCIGIGKLTGTSILLSLLKQLF